jgi:hypothetical protein
MDHSFQIRRPGIDVERRVVEGVAVGQPTAKTAQLLGRFDTDAGPLVFCSSYLAYLDFFPLLFHPGASVERDQRCSPAPTCSD